MDVLLAIKTASDPAGIDLQLFLNGSEVNFSKDLHRALMLLFARYRVWHESRLPNDVSAFKFLEVEQPFEFKQLYHLRGRVRSSGPTREMASTQIADGVAPRRRRTKKQHPLWPLFHPDAPENKDSILEKPDSQPWLTLDSKRLPCDDVVIVFNGEVITGRANAEALLEILQLAPQPLGTLLLRHGAIRTEFAYTVEFGIEPRANLHDLLRNGEYNRFRSVVTFERLALKPVETFQVAMVPPDQPKLDVLQKYLQGVLYREAFGLSASHSRELRQSIQGAMKLADDRQGANGENAEAGVFDGGIDAVFEIAVLVDNEFSAKRLSVGPSGVPGDESTCAYSFRMPEQTAKNLKHKFKITCTSFQPLDNRSFRLLFTEPTRGAVVVVKYQNFSAIDAPEAHVGQGVFNVDRDLRQAVLEVPNNVQMLPGENGAITW